MIDSLKKSEPKRVTAFLLSKTEHEELQNIADQIQVSKSKVLRAFYDGYFQEFIKKLRENKKIK